MKHKPIKQPKFALGVVDKVTPENKEPEKPRKSTLEPARNSKFANTIEEAVSRMSKLGETVEQKKQDLNVDLFLQKQKEKRLQYAKNLNEQFQKQKKQREKKVYKQPLKDAQEKKRYLNELPEIRKFFKDPSQDDPFIIQSHVMSKIKENVKTIDSEQLKTTEEERFLVYSGEKDICWQKAEKLADNCTKIHFADIHKNGELEIKSDILSVQQSEELMNVLVLIASAPKLYKYLVLNLEDLEDENPNVKTLCVFRMFKRGLPQTIITNWNIECKPLQNNKVIAYSRCNNKNRFWIPILQKAFKKLKGASEKQLAQLSLNNIFNDLVNMDPQIIKFSEEALIRSNFFMAINLMLKNGGYLCLQRKGLIQNAVSYQNRFYPIKQVKVFKDIKSCKIIVINPWKNQILKADGLDTLGLPDILANFNRLIVLKSYPSTWAGISFHSNFFSYGLPSAGNTEWTKNNQHSLTITRNVYVRILMKQQQNQTDQYGFLLFRAEQHDLKILSMNLERLIVNAKSSNPNEANVTVYLQKGSYFIVPYTHTKSYDKYVFFRFEIFYSDSKGLTIGKTKYTDVKYQNISKESDKIIAELEENQRFQKPKIETILQPGTKHSRLTEDTVTKTDLMTMGIVHPKANGNIDQFFIPGLFNTFIVKDSVIVQQKAGAKKINQVRQDISFEQNNQILKYLIGADAYTQEVNVNMMNDALYMLDQQVDLALYELGDEGFQSLLEVVMQQPKIQTMNISGNLLTDQSIVYLCYYLEKSHHTQLKLLNISNNDIGEVGFQSLIGLSQRLPVLETIKAEGNPLLTRDMVRKLAKVQRKKR